MDAESGSRSPQNPEMQYSLVGFTFHNVEAWAMAVQAPVVGRKPVTELRPSTALEAIQDVRTLALRLSEKDRNVRNFEALLEGKRLHSRLTMEGETDRDAFIGNLLIQMYGKCGSVEDARWVFDRIHHLDEVSWGNMISAYTQNGHPMEAIQLFHEMDSEGAQLDMLTFSSVLGACASLRDISAGKLIHARILSRGLEADEVVQNALLNMYAKCGNLEDAKGAFDQMQQLNAYACTAMIEAYARHGHNKEARRLMKLMDLEGVKPNGVTFLNTLGACSSREALADGRSIYERVLARGFELDVVMGTALIGMFGKCGSVGDAKAVFDGMRQRNVVTWTAMIGIHVVHGFTEQAMQVYRSMDLEGVKPNEITFINILGACTTPGALAEGRLIHQRVVSSGCKLTLRLENSLVNMYAKCGELEQARQVFDRMQHRSVVSWTAVIAGYAQEGHGREAINLFHKMDQEGVEADSITYVAVLVACACLAALAEGKHAHSRTVDCGFEADVLVGTTLVNMYGKCGRLEDATRAFDKMPKKNLFSWTAILAAYAQHGHSEEVLEFYRRMNLEGEKPNAITFTSILHTCSHAGSLEQGWDYFSSMVMDFGIRPVVDHYVCMVDLLGRAGLLDEAERLINGMPFEQDAVEWGTLLGACKIHGDVARAAQAAGYAFKLDPEEPAHYVLLSNAVSC